MKRFQHKAILFNRLTVCMLGFLLFLMNSFNVDAQSVSMRKGLSFGDFIVIGQGNITVTPDNNNTRTKTGGIILRDNSNQSHAATFLYALKNKNKSFDIIYPSSLTLYGNNGGSLNLSLSDSSPSFDKHFIKARSNNMYVYIGGILTTDAPSLNPVGTYSVSFQVEFRVNN